MREEAKKEEWKTLYDLALRFAESKPWKEFRDMDLFAVKFSEEETAYFSIMGKAGECIGFSLYRGLEGYNDLMGIVNSQILNIPQNDIMFEQNCISMFLGDREEVPKEQYAVIKDLGLKFRGKGNWIYFETYEKGYMPYILNREEVLTCIRYLEQLVCAIAYYREHDCKVSFVSEKLFEYSCENGIWHGKAADIPFYEYRIPSVILEDEIMAAKLKKAAKQKKSGTILELGMFYYISAVTDDAYDKPMIPKIAIMADHKKGVVLYQQMLAPKDDDKGYLANMLADWIMENGEPKEVLVNNPVIEAIVRDLCEKCQIKLSYGSLDTIEDCKNGLHEYMSGQAPYGFADSMDNVSSEETEMLMNALQEVGLDIADMKKKAMTMTEDEFRNDMMEEMLKAMERLGMSDTNIPYFQHDLKNRKQKLEVVKEFFGYGEMPKQVYEEYIKDITIDYSDRLWKDGLKESRKNELLELARDMGADVDNSFAKDMLVSLIISKTVLEPALLSKCLNKEERKLLKFLWKKANKIDGDEMDLEDFKFSKESVMKLLTLGLVDIGYGNDEYSINLEILPVEEVVDMLQGCL